MGSTNYYNGFDVVLLDADGVRVPLPNETFDVEIVGGDSLGTIETDEFGRLAAGFYEVGNVGDLIVFSHATYPEVFYRTFAASAAEAEVHPDNYIASYIAENLASRDEPVAYSIWVRDNTNADAADQNVGIVPANTAAKFPLQNLVNTDFRVFVHPIYEGQKSFHLRYDESPYQDITAAGRVGPDTVAVPANRVFAGPTTGADDFPTFRALVSDDVPNLSASKITSGTMATARLGSGTANNTTFLRGDQTYANPLTVGKPVASGGASRVLYEDSSQNLAASTRFLFDGTDLTLIDPAAASSGTPNVHSPYIYQKGARWDGAASVATGLRTRFFSQNPSGVEVGGLAVDFLSNSSWQSSFRYANKDDDYLITRIRLGSPAADVHGGILDVNYDGSFTFRRLDASVAPLNASLIGSNASAFPNFTQQPGAYGPELRAYLNSPILFKRGYPGWEGTYSEGTNGSGGEYVQSDLPIGIGVSGSPAAMLHVLRTTTPQRRTAYDGSNYKDESVSSSGVFTHDITGSAPEEKFNDPVTFDSSAKRKCGTGTLYAGVGGPIATFHSDVNSISAEDDAYSKSIAANTFTEDGQYLKARFVLIFASGTDLKYVRVKFGTHTVFWGGDISQSGGSCEVEVILMRASSSSLKCFANSTIASGDTTDDQRQSQVLTGLTFSNAYDLKLRISSDVDDDLTASFGLIEWYPAA